MSGSIEIQNPKFKIPVAWTIAGSDPGGGAGLQADLKTMQAFDVHGCSVVAAITVQNTLGVEAVDVVSAELVEKQLDALARDLPPTAIKTGMLGSPDVCKILSPYLAQPGVSVVCDPVLRSTSGHGLFDETALSAYKESIYPYTTVLTPNLPETRLLLGEDLPPEEAAEHLLDLGPASVLIKGGHAEGSECRDYWTDGKTALWLSSPRIDSRHTHGTGCILASAIASSIALGQDLPEAIIAAKTFLNQCLKSPANVGAGHGPMRIETFRNDPLDRPNIAHK